MFMINYKIIRLMFKKMLKVMCGFFGYLRKKNVKFFLIGLCLFKIG